MTDTAQIERETRALAGERRCVEDLKAFEPRSIEEVVERRSAITACEDRIRAHQRSIFELESDTMLQWRLECVMKMARIDPVEGSEIDLIAEEINCRKAAGTWVEPVGLYEMLRPYRLEPDA